MIADRIGCLAVSDLPDELAAELGSLDVQVVQLRDDVWRPVLGELLELLVEIDGFVIIGHGFWPQPPVWRSTV